MYTEEADLCYRAKQKGFQAFFFPFARIIHFGGGSIDNKLQFFEQFHRTQIHFIKKNFTGLRKYLGVFLKEVGIAVRVPAYFLAGLLTWNSQLLRKSSNYLIVFLRSLR
jgi:GT2 family glycosyltransferase